MTPLALAMGLSPFVVRVRAGAEAEHFLSLSQTQSD
jgi:hypothetical protein